MVIVVGWFSLVIEAFILLLLFDKMANITNKISQRRLILSMSTLILLINLPYIINTQVIVLAVPSSFFGSNQFALNQTPSTYDPTESRPIQVSGQVVGQEEHEHVYPPSKWVPVSTLERMKAPSYNSPSSTSLVPVSCQLPPTWAGKWYQMGNKDSIRFSNSEISDRGVCRQRKDDKFLFENRTTGCLVCMVINERHINVLQYKESAPECNISTSRYAVMLRNGHLSHEILDNLCSSITGDAQLESLFRLETPPIECPIIGQYTFTYDNCKVIPSSLESCADKKHLHFKFNACPDVSGSESKSEVLKCYADWTEGSNYYMIGRLEPTNNNIDRGKFRCFVYERSPDGQTILMAQSFEENCYGLISASEGPRTMKITAKPPTSRCYFPDYITGRENWLTVDNSLIFTFNQNSSTYQVKETRERSIEEEVTCIKQEFVPQQVTRRHHQYAEHYHSYHSSPSDTGYDQFLVQSTKNCRTLTYCIRIHKRASSLILIEFYLRSHYNDESCGIHPTTVPTSTVDLTSAEQQPCPFDGIYSIEAPLESDFSYNPSDLFVCPRNSFLAAHCGDFSLIHIQSICTTKTTTKNLHCYGNFLSQHGEMSLLLEDDDRIRYLAIIHREEQEQQPQSYINAIGAGDNLQRSRDNTHQSRIDFSPQQVRLSGMNQPQPFWTAASSSPQIINMSISIIGDPSFYARRDGAMKVRLYRKSSCAEVSRSQSSKSSSSAQASSARLQANSVNLLIMTSCMSTILSLYYRLRFLYFRNINVRRE